MQAAFFHGVRDIRVRDISDAEPKAGEVLVAVTAVGICGSDLHTYLLGNIGGVSSREPIVLGHEAGGVILALGPEAPPHLRVGQRVAIDPATPCLQCEFCQHGQHHLCLNLKFMGYFPQHGALQERMVHPARSVVPVPDSISDVGAAMLEPLGVALHAARLGAVQHGEDVIVIGCGTIGLLCVRLARLAGARRVFAVDRYAWRLDMAANFGADYCLNIEQVDPVEEVMRVTGKRGVDVAFEAAWVTDTANQCALAARNGGRVIIVGIPAEDEFTLKASVVRRKELTIIYSRRMNHTYEASIALAERGLIDLDALGKFQMPLARAAEAFEAAADYHQGVVRAMILPQWKG
ncbi:MAG: alcohol dehydrogenase [Candidatus Thermofonsia Clade 1 bacterium]|uniref:Alcohol dehydrogenase n=1 Tax=Candidatus Thermofonsia Clade 1 bacterium TaxID=2364210 RepID=A0A2M8P2I2_9CHLR|nr:MAG: alcohol dehydrogenase [Candidatus Thermofonsia Clade 1 bacterium]